ncbi:hypothetical protein ACIOD0_34460 [Kitasatospora albolonga]
MPGRRWRQRGGSRSASGHPDARASGHEPFAQLPVPRTAPGREADGPSRAAFAQHYGAGGAGFHHHGVRRYGRAAHNDAAADVDADLDSTADSTADFDDGAVMRGAGVHPGEVFVRPPFPSVRRRFPYVHYRRRCIHRAAPTPRRV